MLSLEQKMSVAQTAHSQFEQAYQLVAAINGSLARNEAWDVARELRATALTSAIRPSRRRAAQPSQRAGTASARAAGRWSVSWLSSANARANATISTIWKRCIRSWKRASRRWPTASPTLRNSAHDLASELEQPQSRTQTLDAPGADLAGGAKQPQPAVRAERRTV